MFSVFWLKRTKEDAGAQGGKEAEGLEKASLSCLKKNRPRGPGDSQENRTMQQRGRK